MSITHQSPPYDGLLTPSHPLYEPLYGELGVLNHAPDGSSVQCHICGRWFRSLAKHVERRHGCAPEDYRATFGLMLNTPLWSKALSARQASHAERIGNLRRLRAQLPETCREQSLKALAAAVEPARRREAQSRIEYQQRMRAAGQRSHRAVQNWLASPEGKRAHNEANRRAWEPLPDGKPGPQRQALLGRTAQAEAARRGLIAAKKSTYVDIACANCGIITTYMKSQARKTCSEDCFRALRSTAQRARLLGKPGRTRGRVFTVEQRTKISEAVRAAHGRKHEHAGNGQEQI